MMVSTHIYALFGSVNDPGRIAAQVVTGIGFLGAGTIIRQGNIVRGLTTAAGLWVVSGIGLAIGVGFYFGAFITVVLALLILFLLRWVEGKIFARGEYENVVVEMKDMPGQIGKIGTLMGNLGVNIRNVIIEDKGEDTVIIEFQVTLPSHISRNRLMVELSQLDEVIKVSEQTLGFI